MRFIGTLVYCLALVLFSFSLMHCAKGSLAHVAEVRHEALN